MPIRTELSMMRPGDYLRVERYRVHGGTVVEDTGKQGPDVVMMEVGASDGDGRMHQLPLVLRAEDAEELGATTVEVARHLKRKR